MDSGLVTVASAFSVRETADRLAGLIVSAGLTVFARIDHAGNAEEAGLDLRPTELLVFGHARGGTPLMQDRQTAGIDLPVKALAWEDADGRVWLTYNDADWIAVRHGLGARSEAAVRALATGVASLITQAANRTDGHSVR